MNISQATHDTYKKIVYQSRIPTGYPNITITSNYSKNYGKSTLNKYNFINKAGKPTKKSNILDQSNPLDNTYSFPGTEKNRKMITEILDIPKKSHCPFGLTEQRFKWLNLNDKSFPLNPLDANIKIKIKKYKNQSYFENGIAGFYFDKFNKYDFDKKHRFTKKMCNKSVENSNIKNTKRVIIPKYNKEKNLIKFTKKRCDNNKKDKNNCKNLAELINKTPINVEKRGKRHYLNKNFNEISTKENYFFNNAQRRKVLQRNANFDHLHYLNRSVNEYANQDMTDLYEYKIENAIRNNIIKHRRQRKSLDYIGMPRIKRTSNSVDNSLTENGRLNQRYLNLNIN